MKKLIALAAMLVTAPAFAEQAPAPEEIIAQFYVETGQLRSALGDAQKQIIALKKQQVQAKEAALPTPPAPASK
jgi:hypothetical protein